MAWDYKYISKPIKITGTYTYSLLEIVTLSVMENIESERHRPLFDISIRNCTVYFTVCIICNLVLANEYCSVTQETLCYSEALANYLKQDLSDGIQDRIESFARRVPHEPSRELVGLRPAANGGLVNSFIGLQPIRLTCSVNNTLLVLLLCFVSIQSCFFWLSIFTRK